MGSDMVFVEQLVECAERYGFESNSQVYSYLLSSYVRANKVTDAVGVFQGHAPVSD